MLSAANQKDVRINVVQISINQVMILSKCGDKRDLFQILDEAILEETNQTNRRYNKYFCCFF